MRRFARLAGNTIDYLSGAGAAVAGIGLFAVMLFILYGVVMRYVFRNPTAWSIEFPSYMFLLIIALTLAYVHRGRGHIGVELLVIRLPERVRRGLFIIGSIVLIIYAGIMAWGGWLKALDHLLHGERSVAMGLPLFAVQIVLPIGLILLCLQALVEISKGMAGRKTQETVVDNKDTKVS